MIRISVKEFKELMNQKQDNTETTNTLDAWIIKHILRKEEPSPTSTFEVNKIDRSDIMKIE